MQTTTAAQIEPTYDLDLEGISARYYVRGALDPSLDLPADVDAYAGRVMLGHDPETALLSPENRARIAGEVLSGWLCSHESDRALDRLLWLRYMSGTVLEVREVWA